MWDWLSIIVIIAIVLVVLDGLRRKFSEKNALKMKLDNSQPGGDIANDHNSELPSGGARTISRESSSTQQVARRRREVDARERVEPAFGDILDNDSTDYQAEASTDTELADDTNHHIGILTPAEAVEALDHPSGISDEVNRKLLDADLQEEAQERVKEHVQEEDLSDAHEEAQQTTHAAENSYDDQREASFTDEVTDPKDTTFNDNDDEPISSEASEERPLMADRGDAPKTRSRQKKASQRLSKRFFRPNSVQSELALNETEASTPVPQSEDDSGHVEDVAEAEAVEEVIVINVMAPQGQPFEGAQLLQILLRQGMRLGQMSIFHRHADNNGSGPVMFSMANMVKPGTFDMANMENFTTPGVSLFTQLPSRLRHMHNFEVMLETAQCLRDELNGELKDENRSVLTRQTIEHYRQRIRDFELQRLARK